MEMAKMGLEIIPEKEKDSFELYCRLIKIIDEFAEERGRVKLRTIEHAIQAVVFDLHRRIILQELEGG
jgi:hypothetical protein